MSTAWAQLIGVLTLVSMLTFIAIWLWAWLPHHKRDFDTLARVPMNDDQQADGQESARQESKCREGRSPGAAEWRERRSARAADEDTTS